MYFFLVSYIRVNGVYYIIRVGQYAIWILFQLLEHEDSRQILDEYNDEENPGSSRQFSSDHDYIGSVSSSSIPSKKSAQQDADESVGNSNSSTGKPKNVFQFDEVD